MVWEQETENSAPSSIYSIKNSFLIKSDTPDLVITGSQYGARVVTVHAKIVNLLYCLVCDTATRS